MLQRINIIYSLYNIPSHPLQNFKSHSLSQIDIEKPLTLFDINEPIFRIHRIHTLPRSEYNSFSAIHAGSVPVMVGSRF
jgi:hypothetical protein